MEWNNQNNRAGSRRILLVFCFALASASVFAAGVEVDGATATTLDTAPNGVPIVNIARPNRGGLSHNTYRRFDVESNGLILNNATRSVVNTQLGGQILGNSRLDSPAQVILNEVTSTNRSYLRGYTEVAGHGADVVIANPNGISINGAGFINAPRVTLTTGLPEIDLLGNLSGFDVRGGEIAIDGDGLNTGLQSVTSIYTHFLNLNAKLHAQDLDVALGKNQIDYPGRKIVSRSRGAVNRVLLDSSALGGMYANKIVLVGTDQGLGMKLPPEVIAASGDIQISNDGRLVLQKLDARGDIQMQAGAGIESSGSVYAAGSIDIEARDELDVKAGLIAAYARISITADRVENAGTLLAGLNEDGSMNDRGIQDIHARVLVNASEIISTNAIGVESTFVDNQGLFSAASNLSISADRLVNEATLFSGDDAQLLVRTDLSNRGDASIFTVNDLLFAADEQLNPSAHITNQLALIQSLQGDIDIHANRFDNRGDGDLQYEMIYYDLGRGLEVSDPNTAMNINLAYSSGYTKHNNNARRRWVNEVLDRLSRQAPLLYTANANDIRQNRSARFLAIETRLVDHSTTTPAYLDSGNDLNLNISDFINYNAVTAAARDINFNIGGDYLNQALSATENVTDYQYSVRAKHSRNWRDEDKYSSIGRSYYIPVARSKGVSTDTVTQAGRNIEGDIGGQAVNAGVLIGQYQSSSALDPADFSPTGISLPANDFGLFVKSRAPDSQYLIETNPRFNRFGNFVSSKYLLERLDFSASATLKRLGDAFYESKLIRDSVFAQSGRRFLDPAIRNDNEQFRYLMENALVAQGELQLAPGVALEREQIDRLTRDIVWLEQQEIGGQLVLVPTVYLANSPKAGIHGGRIVAGEDSRLVVASLSNGGLIEADRNLVLETAGKIENRGAMTAGETLSLHADGDIENVSGRIIGRDVTVESLEGSIVNRREHEEYLYSQKNLSYSTRILGAAGLIDAEDSLTLQAADGIEVSGSEISGGQVRLEADTVDITATTQSEHYFAGDKRNHVTESSTLHFASIVNGDDIVILSPGSTRIIGSRIGAKQDLHIASDNIDIRAVNDSAYYARLSTEDKTLGESVSSQKTFRSTSIGSQLSGTTVVLVTEHGDIDITGSEISARTSLVMNSAQDIRIAAGHDERLEESYRHESGWFSGDALYSESEDLEGRINRTAVRSRIEAGTISLNAADEIEMAGVDISVNEGLNAIAQDISVRSASDEERSYSKHTKITVGLGDLASNPGNIDDLVEFEDGKLKLQLGSAVYENAESSTRQTSAIASQIAAGSIRFDAGGNTVGDITIEGSDLLAEDDITLNASGGVALLDGRHEFTREDLTQEGSAVVSWTLQNEYEQVTRAIKAVREAERDLRQARDDYNQYQDELKAQKAVLARLKQEYAVGEGFIEQADINDFKRDLERLEDDEAFYKTNIALATVTLASKTTALIQQTGRAASSSGTYGFNMGIELEIDALERQFDEYYWQSRASNLSANQLTINVGDDAWIRGSYLLANEGLDIFAQDIDIVAGSSVRDSREREQHVSLGYSWDLLGGASSTDPQDLGGAISGDGSLLDSESRSYTNSQLLAENIRLITAGDTTIRGADVVANASLEIVTDNLDVASVQDISSSESRSQGLSYSGAGTGANAAEGYTETLQTQITRLFGRQVDITVADHTGIEGAVIASVDAEGRDNGQLKLTTETLSADSLNNTVNDDNRSLGFNAGQTSRLDYQDETRDSRTRTLATLGSGDIQITDTEKSNTRFLNTDIENTEVSIFDIDSYRGLSGELDTRLLSEQGRKEIAEDWLKTKMIGNTIELMASTERVGIEDFFKETRKTHETYEAVKQQVATDPALAAMLQDPSLTPELKQQMLDQVTDAVMLKLGFNPHYNKIIATDETTPDGSRILGFYSDQTGNAYINDPENQNTSDLITTAGHEASHAIDYKSDVKNVSPADRKDNNIYAENFGENLTSYTDFALSSNGYDRLASSNEHVAIGSDQVRSNTTEFNSLDPEQGDFRQLHSLEIEWIRENAKRFASYLCRRSECITQEEAENRLIAQALNRVQFGTEEWDPEANYYLRKGQGVILPQDQNYPETGPLTTFYATPEQRINANIYVEEYRKHVTAYREAGISQPTLDQILQDAKKHGEYSEKMAERLIKGSLIIGGVVLAPVAAGTPVAAEIAAFSKNPIGYCMANPASCALAAEEALYTAGGAVSVNSVVPEIPKFKISKLIDDTKPKIKILLPDYIKSRSEANITNSDETVLGHFPGYIDKANSRGASYFDIGDSWNGLSDTQKWAANTHFLDIIASKENQVNLSLPKTKVRPGSWLEEEIKYLIKEKGYVWINQWSLKPRDKKWTKF